MTGYLAIDTVEVTKPPGTKYIVCLEFKQAYLHGLLNCDWQLSCVSRWAASLWPIRCLDLVRQRLPSWLTLLLMASWVWPSSPFPLTTWCLSSTTWSIRVWCCSPCSLSTWAGAGTGWKPVSWEHGYHLTLNLRVTFVVLCSYSNSEQDSEVVFGGVDSSHYTGQITWIPLSSATYWQINMDRHEENTNYQQNIMSTKLPSLIIHLLVFFFTALPSMGRPWPVLVAAWPSLTLVPPWLLAQPVTSTTWIPGLEPQPTRMEKWVISSYRTIWSKFSPFSEPRVNRHLMLWRQNSQMKTN